jgi:hypothetical protein
MKRWRSDLKSNAGAMTHNNSLSNKNQAQQQEHHVPITTISNCSNDNPTILIMGIVSASTMS